VSTGAGGTSFATPDGRAFGASGDLRVDVQRVHRIAEERGYAAGRSRAEAELRAAVEAAGAVAARLEASAPRDTVAVAHAIVEVALTVARRILDAEVSADPTVLAHALEGAVSQVNGSPLVRIFLHPDAVEAVRETWEAIHGRAYLGKDWSFEADPTLPAGGCVLRHEHGFVDAGLEAQLEEIGIALDRAIPSLARQDGAENAA
jgi:flagellar assembly protein FliH